MSTTSSIPHVEGTDREAVDELAALVVAHAEKYAPDDIVEFAESVASACVLAARRERDRRLRVPRAFRVVQGREFQWDVISPDGQRVVTLPTEHDARRHADIRNEMTAQARTGVAA